MWVLNDGGLRERERERESECVCVRERERDCGVKEALVYISLGHEAVMIFLSILAVSDPSNEAPFSEINPQRQRNL